MSIYHEGPVKDVADKYKLMHIRADSGNCDGRAILESAGRVKRRISPDRNVLFILISDGAPTAAKVMKGMFEKSKNITWLENNVKIMSSLSDENVAEIDAMAEELCK